MRTPLDYRICSYCGKEIAIYHKKRLEQKDVCCSKECAALLKISKNKEDNNFMNCICDICGKIFHQKNSQKKSSKKHYCCRECFRLAKKEYMKGEGNHQYNLKGSKNSSWKSDEKINTYGYKQIRVLNHPFKNNQDFVMEHRLVAEKYLLTEENSIEINGQKYLKPEYIVHHIDGNRLNNNVNNLMVLTKEQHNEIHRDEKIKRQSKAVAKIDDNDNIIETYNSIKEAAEKNNAHAQNIGTSCKKHYKAKGYYWKYL